MCREDTMKTIQSILVIFVCLIIMSDLIYKQVIFVDEMDFDTDKFNYILSVVILILRCLIDAILIFIFIILVVLFCVEQIQLNDQQNNHYTVYP